MSAPLRWGYTRVVADRLARSAHTTIPTHRADEAAAHVVVAARFDDNYYLPHPETAKPKIMAALAESLGGVSLDDASIGQQLLLNDLTDEVYQAARDHERRRITRRRILTQTPTLLRRI